MNQQGKSILIDISVFFFNLFRQRTFEDATEEFPHFIILHLNNTVLGYIKISDCSKQEEDTALLESCMFEVVSFNIQY